METDNWANRSEAMKCRTCMSFVEKKKIPVPGQETPLIYRAIGRCRRHAPTMGGFPVVFSDDFCGDHKLDENKV